ncbi:MAG: putative hydrolase YxeP [Candidatus Accumulibacter phosphatis]|uniref:Putative hydrolase YxeP n=1 Tax=Candidatus Accumulibacter phosphatis TaxID=327160 RepID=A0A080LX57_9PROT|nr:M20 aminoacylase family protein [Accumulibacter sp.]KFB72420.1 MAG: putative hydrolase YxeP [Candidatus Accumulibacter phosphatis]HRF10851.1 M20 aminoacylase family protein [Candidatus Accumulibacter phosphatis]
MTTLNIPFLFELAVIRRDLHAHPELAFNELRTSELVARELTRYGLEVDCGLASTGVIGILRKGNSPRAIGLRADMDALPLHEKNDFPHRSRNEGRMHACGHDGHTTILLGAARYMAEHRDDLDFDGTVYFIFQPAEESEGGAEVMIAEGLFEKFPMDAVFGLHNWPGIPVGEMAVMPGPVMAGTCTFEISVRGQGCHAAMPHQGVDTLVASSHLMLALQTVVARNVHPCESAVLSITQMHAGEAWNVIPDDAVLRGTIRSFNVETQNLVERAIERLCHGIASAFGAQIAVQFDHRYPPTVNSAAETEVCRRVASELLGADQVREKELPSMGAEDFAYMLHKKPGCYVWLGNGPGTGGCTLHNPHYDFNDKILPLGVSYWVRLVEAVL